MLQKPFWKRTGEIESLSGLLLIVAALTLPHAGVASIVKVGVIQAEGFCTPLVQGNGTPGVPPPPVASNWEGFIPDVVRELGSQLSFVPEFHQVADGRYGAFEEATGNWTGLIGQVLSSSVEFAAAPLTITAQREKHIDFTHEVLDVGLTLLMKRPERLDPTGRGLAFFFSGVFDSGVWGSALAAFLVTSFLLHLNDRYNPREAQAKVAEHLAANTASASPLSQFTLLGSAFYVMSTGCFQGYQRAPRSLCGRCVSLFWWVFACIFVATYTAGFLCALIASGSSQDPAFSYLDARDQFKVDSSAMQAFTPVWIPGGSTEALMRNSTDPLFQFFNTRHAAAAKEDPRVANVRNIADLVDLLSTGYHFVGLVESPMADFYARKSRCELIVTGSPITDREYAFAFPETPSTPNSSLLFGRVNAAILKMRETGFIRHAYQRHFGGPFVPCSGQASPSVASAALGLAGEELARMFRDSLPITLKTFAGPVVFYFLSLLVSAAAALVDVHIYAKLERHQHGAQVLRGNQDEAADEPSFSALAFSEEQRQLQQQQQRQQQQQQQQRQQQQQGDAAVSGDSNANA